MQVRPVVGLRGGGGGGGGGGAEGEGIPPQRFDLW